MEKSLPLLMTTKIATSTLEQISSLRSLSPATLSAISECAETRLCEAGEVVVSHLDTSRDFYVIATGEVRAQMVAPNGRLLTYHLIPQGEMFGEIAAIDGEPRTASIVTEVECVLVRVSSECLLTLMANHPDFALAIVRNNLRTNRRLSQRLFEYHSYNVKGRVYSEILRLTDNALNSTAVITDRDLASRVGTTRENITRIHSELKKKNLIERRHSELRILDRTGIEQLLKNCEFS